MHRKILLFIGIRDIIILTVITSGILAIFFIITPRIQEIQREHLEDFYISYHTDLIKQEVRSFSEQIINLKKECNNLGMGEDEFNRIISQQIYLNRFGAEGEGYFFVLDTDFKMIYHGNDTGLEGVNLYDISSDDNKNLGIAFRKVLSTQNEGYVSYSWQRSMNSLPEEKTTYVLWVPELKWYMAAGFYHADLNNFLGDLQKSSAKSVERSINNIILLSIPIFILWGVLSLWIYSRIRKIIDTFNMRTKTLEQYKILLDTTSIVSRTDKEGHIIYVNKRFEEVTGYKKEDILHKSHNIERHPDTPRELFKDLWQTILNGQTWQGVIKNRKADGESYLKQATIVPILDERGKIKEFVSAGQDITALIEQGKELKRAFMTDTLTGLGNRNKFMADIKAKDITGVALLNIQDFRSLNRIFSQSGGDFVLKDIAEWLVSRLNTEAYFTYRIHGDTFAVLSEEPPEDFIKTMNSLYEERRQYTLDISKTSTLLNLRMGLAQMGQDSFVYAEIAMEKARKTNQGIYICTEENKDNEDPSLSHEFSLIANNIRKAIDEDRVFPVFQPILNTATNQIEKFECLIRILNEDGSILLPNEFLEISKRTRLYEDLTLKIIEKAIDKFENEPYEFAINLGVEDLTNPETIKFLIEKTNSSNVGKRLVVEIIETQELEDMDAANAVLEQLKSRGIKIAIDDFGSGYASFNYLVKLNPDYIKIDGSIIKNLETDIRAKEMVNSVVAFARKSGIKTIAEYVDSKKLLAEVSSMGIDYIQGWLVGKPSRKITETKKIKE